MELFVAYVVSNNDGRMMSTGAKSISGREAPTIERAREIAAEMVRSGNTHAFVAQVVERAELPVDYKKLGDLGDQES